MRTETKGKINAIRLAVLALGAGGFVVGGHSSSLWPMLYGFVCLIGGCKLIKSMWIFVDDDTYIMHPDKGVHAYIQEACYVARKDIPHNCALLAIRGDATAEFQVATLNTIHGGQLVYLSVVLTYCVERTHSAIERFHYRFTGTTCTAADYVEGVLTQFVNRYNRGAFAASHEAEIGTVRWCEEVLKPSLAQALEEEFTKVGLQLKHIAVESRWCGRAVVAKQ